MLRRLGALIAIGNLFAAVIGTQWPFRYLITRYAIRQRWHRIDWARWHHFDRDFAINLVMLIPMGIGYAWWRSRARGPRVMIEAAVIGCATGVALEAAQLLTTQRITQLADAWRNALGVVIGAAIGLAIARLVRAAD